MVGLAQLAEHQIVVLGVVGSSPTTHPNLKVIFLKIYTCYLISLLYNKFIYDIFLYYRINFLQYKNMSGRGAIGSVLALGARGCEFESRRPDHIIRSEHSSIKSNGLCAIQSIFSPFTVKFDSTNLISILLYSTSELKNNSCALFVIVTILLAVS